MSTVENQSQIQNKVTEAMKAGATFAEALDVPKDAMEGGYALAYNNLKIGNYKDAEVLFQMLTLYDYSDPRFSLGLALCREKREDYFAASDAYMLSAMMSEGKDPIPLYHAAICYMKLGQKDLAIQALDTVDEIADDEYNKEIKKTCRELREIISK